MHFLSIVFNIGVIKISLKGIYPEI